MIRKRFLPMRKACHKFEKKLSDIYLCNSPQRVATAMPKAGMQKLLTLFGKRKGCNFALKWGKLMGLLPELNR